ncbi:MAG TPA: aminoglycoside phosphotransferase family protein [Pseudonocardiaceae bacterium]
MLTAALRPVLMPAGARVTSVSWERIGQDFGFTGVTTRLRVDYEPGLAGPATVVAKFPLGGGEDSAYRRTQRESPETARIVAERAVREAWFYRVLAPRLPTPAPRCWASGTDVERSRLVLLLEDIAGARGGDALGGCPPEDVQAVLAAIAPVHAGWWARPDQLAALPNWTGDRAAGERRQRRYRERWAVLAEQHGLRLDARLRRMAARLGDSLADVLDRLGAAPQAVVHADLHLDNVLFTPDQHRAVVVLDWQTVCRGPAAVDLARAIVTSLQPDDRREHEDRLVAGYHRAMRTLGVGERDPAEAHGEYVLALIVYFAGVVGWTARGDTSMTGREAALRDAALGDGRLVSALLDHDADAEV